MSLSGTGPINLLLISSVGNGPGDRNFHFLYGIISRISMSSMRVFYVMASILKIISIIIPYLRNIHAFNFVFFKYAPIYKSDEFKYQNKLYSAFHF